MKTITIIGASGNMGTAISKSLSKGSFRLFLTSTDTDKLANLKKEIQEARPTASVEARQMTERAGESDIFIIALPFQAEKSVAESIKEAARGKIVISISNPMNETYTALVIPPTTSAAEELQKMAS